MPNDPQSPPRWLAHFTEEDYAFLQRFLLSSGSLKDLARDYDISYPTVRLRLDRLIAKARIADEMRDADDFTLLIRSLVADGRLAADVGRAILKEHAAARKGDRRHA